MYNNTYNLEILSRDEIKNQNKIIMDSEILLSKIPTKQPDSFKFPEIIYHAEIREDLKPYEWNFNLNMLNDINFYIQCIEEGYYKVQNKTFNGDILLFLLSKPLSFLEEILIKLGYGITRSDKENAFTLIYWSLYIGLNLKIDLELRNFLVLNENLDIIKEYELQTNKKWEFTTDRATIFYVLFNKCNLHIKIDYTQTLKYKQLVTDDPGSIYNLFKYVYNGKYTLLSPIRYLCSVNTSELEQILEYDDDKLLNLMIKIEYIPIDFINVEHHNFFKYSQQENFIKSLYNNIINKNNKTEKIKILTKKFLHNLSAYKNVIYRKNKPEFPINDSFENLNSFTDLELINFYKPDLNYYNRETLINNIKNNLVNMHIRINHLYNNNNNNLNILSLEPRTISKDNILISIGTLLNYEAYNYDELLESFKSRIFKKPDNNETFLYTHMILLQKCLYECELKDIIHKNLNCINNIENRILKMKELYNSFDNNKKNEIQKILVNFLFLGFFARYWKGIGYEYPHVWKDKKEETTDESNYCSYTEREYNCNLIFDQLTKITDPIILDWIKLIPRIDYNWKDNTYVYGNESLYDILTTTYNSEFCLTHFSNICIQTIYSIFKIVLNYNDLEINTLIKNLYVEHNFDFCPHKIINTTHIDYTLKLENYKK